MSASAIARAGSVLPLPATLPPLLELLLDPPAPLAAPPVGPATAAKGDSTHVLPPPEQAVAAMARAVVVTTSPMRVRILAGGATSTPREASVGNRSVVAR